MRRITILILFFLSIVGLLSPSFAQNQDSVKSFSLLAMGDVNLGRTVGQIILKGKTDYPFEKFSGVLARADAVFANLECPITDQNGETQDRKSNVVFCAPPQASKTIRRAGITIVSTANNHAFDYRFNGIRETINYLKQDSVQFIGTASDPGTGFNSAIIERNGIKVGFLAYTQMVNIRDRWKGMISVFDSARACHEIDSLKPSVDFIIVSYHGGDEYKDVPDKSAERDLRLLAELGADVVLGHHPHVPQGIVNYRGSWIFNSLGNTVFYQPQHYWTQRSFAALIGLKIRNAKKEISSIELIPYRPGYQPKIDLNVKETEELMNRIQTLSTVSITHSERGYFVEPSVKKTSQ